ncbi:hypothetical protein KL86PLE_90717 [uncultured Pleomorphomonas sp.]|uniref:Uncharacterized protein n=1 Tax=uncultured Pleomorphomonas sp. TaxID=442121 RepID=A0A212LQS9_9HYPH|nr:hypothetical protein KL86PLE_90717 [uncultured Pleomorphomonas sp.]
MVDYPSLEVEKGHGAAHRDPFDTPLAQGGSGPKGSELPSS